MISFFLWFVSLYYIEVAGWLFLVSMGAYGAMHETPSEALMYSAGSAALWPLLVVVGAGSLLFLLSDYYF